CSANSSTHCLLIDCVFASNIWSSRELRPKDNTITTSSASLDQTMKTGICRAVVLETPSLNGRQLSLIGHTLAEVLSLMANGLAATRRPMSHMILDAIDGSNTVSIIPLVDITSDHFRRNYFGKLSTLGLNGRTGVSWRASTAAAIDVCAGIGLAVRQIQVSARKGSDSGVKHVELTYVCGRHKDQVMRDFCRLFVAKQMDLSFLTVLNILCIASNGETNGFQPLVCGPSGAVLNHRSDLEIPEKLEALTELQTIDGNGISIDGYFKVWLLEVNASSEKVRIYLNSGSNEEFVVKCDLREGILDLNRMSVNPMNGNQRESLPLIPNVFDMNRCDLYIAGLIKYSGLCDSVTYGIPYVLSANCSTDVSLEEVAENWNRFHGLIEVMNEKKAFIVLELKHKSCPKLFFALMSTMDTKTLLLKSIAAKELLLPYFHDSLTDMFSGKPSKAAVQSVAKQLNRFEVNDIYNPLVGHLMTVQKTMTCLAVRLATRLPVRSSTVFWKTLTTTRWLR
ncbi:unnamed protein product, partial [Medioppia subpectinata]